jgi:hypothetical protein
MPGASDCYGKGVKGRLDMDDKTSQAIAARGSALPEDAVDRRIREIEAREAEERAQRTTRAMQRRQQQAAEAESKKWMDWVDARVKTHFEQWYAPMFLEQCEPLRKAIGEALADERALQRREVEATIAEERRASEARLAAMEQRVVHQYNEQRMAEWRDRYAERDRAFNDTTRRSAQIGKKRSRLPSR